MQHAILLSTVLPVAIAAALGLAAGWLAHWAAGQPDRCSEILLRLSAPPRPDKDHGR